MGARCLRRRSSIKSLLTRRLASEKRRKRRRRGRTALQHLRNFIMPGTTPNPEDDDAISSFLWKRSRHLRVWRKRRAVLRSSGFLTLHRGDTIRAAIALSPECRVERAPEAHRALFAFLITGPGLRVYLGADSEAEAIRWVLLLGERCRSEVVEPPLEPAARWFNGAPAQQPRVQWPQAAASSSAAAAAASFPDDLSPLGVLGAPLDLDLRVCCGDVVAVAGALKDLKGFF